VFFRFVGSMSRPSEPATFDPDGFPQQPLVMS
jgi:hypothetical protein